MYFAFILAFDEVDIYTCGILIWLLNSLAAISCFILSRQCSFNLVIAIKKISIFFWILENIPTIGLYIFDFFQTEAESH